MKLKMIRHIVASCLILAMTFFMTGWTDCGKQSRGASSSVEASQPDPLRTLAAASDGLAGGIKLTISTKRQLAQEKLISPDEELKLTNILRDVNSAGNEYNNVLISLKADTPENRGRLLAALDKVGAGIERLNSQGVLHIKNEGARQRASLTIAGMRAAIATIRLTINNAPALTPSPATTPQEVK